jgi:hypothetical protein
MATRPTNFEDTLKQGKVGESRIANWLKAYQYLVLPVYEKEIGEGKGPQVFSLERNYVAPDLLAFRDGKALWIEAKTKSVFTWHRITGRWTTGIDLRHYTDYCALAARSPWPVWLLFLHTQAYTSEPPHSSPTGLYGNTLAYLQEHENHRSDKWANGMVYWAIDHLKQLATLTADGNLSAPNLPSRN